MNKTLKIGLTGGIGSGKSLVLNILSQKGVPILQTDLLGHQLLTEKKFAAALAHQFGLFVLDRKGGVDRKKLGKLIFEDPRKREALNQLLHPEIRKRVARWILRESRKSPPPFLVIVEVPLLFERGYYKAFDGILCVSAPLKLRRERLFKRGWGLAEIKKREKTQWSQTRKNQKADWILDNSKGPQDLEDAVGRWFEKLKK